jgi:4-hydroxy-tetrahydrodipicolinate synthase
VEVRAVIPLPTGFLRGSYPPLVTPLRGDEIDFAAYASLVERQVREGSHGLLVNGTTAEPSLLTVAERMQLCEVAVRAAARRLPVVVATGSQSHAETVALTEHAAAAGADAVLVVTPYYVRPPERGLVAYFADLARRTPLPLLVYHIPGRAGVSLTIETLRQIAAAAPSFVGMKHASEDLSLVTQALADFGPEFRIFVGLEELSFPMLAIGAAGMMNAVANLAPRRVAALYEACARGDLAGARRLHFDLFELNRAIFFDTNPIPLKYMMKRLGLLAENAHRLPMLPASPEIAARLDEVLARGGLE